MERINVILDTHSREHAWQAMFDACVVLHRDVTTPVLTYSIMIVTHKVLSQ